MSCPETLPTNAPGNISVNSPVRSRVWRHPRVSLRFFSWAPAYWDEDKCHVDCAARSWGLMDPWLTAIWTCFRRVLGSQFHLPVPMARRLKRVPFIRLAPSGNKSRGVKVSSGTEAIMSENGSGPRQAALARQYRHQFFSAAAPYTLTAWHRRLARASDLGVPIPWRVPASPLHPDPAVQRYRGGSKTPASRWASDLTSTRFCNMNCGAAGAFRL